jgi:hypothetical protein
MMRVRMRTVAAALAAAAVGACGPQVDPDPGSAGSGNAGEAGSAGMGGNAGNAGTGGNAGSAGMGGNAGNAGTGGNAGNAGGLGGESGNPGDYVEVVVGQDSCVRRRNGTVKCWGLVSQNTPPGVFTDISAASNRHCGIRLNGSIECWGGEYDGFWRPGPFIGVEVGGSRPLRELLVRGNRSAATGNVRGSERRR